MKRLLVNAILGVGLLFCVTQAYAYTVDLHDGCAFGITDLTIGSYGTFDIRFKYGTATAIFGGGPITFDNDGDASWAASNAINAVLNADSINSVGYRNSNIAVYMSEYYVPNSYNGSSIGGTGNRYPYVAPYQWLAVGQYNTYADGEYVFAVFTPSAPVPVPAAVWLLGSGLIGLIGIRRFRK